MNLEQHLNIAVSAVREASAVCQRVQADLVNAGTVSKDDKSPVTVADFAAQAVVCARLGAAFADLPVVGDCLLYTSPSPRDQRGSRMPSSA